MFCFVFPGFPGTSQWSLTRAPAFCLTDSVLKPLPYTSPLNATIDPIQSPLITFPLPHWDGQNYRHFLCSSAPSCTSYSETVWGYTAGAIHWFFTVVMAPVLFLFCLGRRYCISRNPGHRRELPWAQDADAGVTRYPCPQRAQTL